MIPRPRYKLYLSGKIFRIILAKMIAGKVYWGKDVEKFENEFKKYIGSKHAIATSMARTSLYLLLKAYGLKKGDEVIISGYTIPDVINMIICAGCKPVFVDIDENTYNMDSKKIEKKITKRTKAIVQTHLYGQPDDIDAINKIAKKHGLITIDDCAQAYGARYKSKKVGTHCDASYFSFSSYKNGTTFYGGIITTDNDGIASKVLEMIEEMPYPKLSFLIKRIIRDMLLWLVTMRFFFMFAYPVVGLVNKIDDTMIDRMLSTKHILRTQIPKEYLTKYTNMQAAIGMEQLKRVDIGNKRRMENAEFYNKNLKNIKEVKILKIIPKAESIYLNYPIRVKNRKKVLKTLFKAGIDSTSGNVNVCSDMKIYEKYSKNCKCPIASKVSKEIMYLPIQPQLKKEQLQYIVKKLKEAME